MRCTATAGHEVYAVLSNWAGPKVPILCFQAEASDFEDDFEDELQGADEASDEDADSLLDDESGMWLLLL